MTPLVVTAGRAPLKLRLLVASASLAFLVALAFGVLLVALLGLRGAERSHASSDRVAATASELEQYVLDVESDARRYGLSHRAADLGPLLRAKTNAILDAERLVELSRGDPVQERFARRALSGFTLYMAAWRRYAARASATDPRSSDLLALDDSAERGQDAIRADLTSLVREMERRSAVAAGSARRTERYAIALAGIGLGGSLLLIALYAAYVTRRIIEPVRRVATATRRLASGLLHERVEESGDDEVAELAASFNTMAASIETQQRELAGRNRELERLANVLRAVIDSTVDAIALTDLAGDVKLANRPLRLLEEEHGEEFARALERLRERGDEPSVHELELAEPRRFLVGFTTTVRGDDGALIGRLWTLRDVTQERELERMKDDLVATVSHELRTPLTSLVGFLDLLRRDDAGTLSPAQERYLGIVERSSQRLQRLVGDLLFVAELDAGGLRLHAQEGIALDDVVAEAVELAGADERARELELRLERNGPVPLRGDRERLGQLALNLLSNAVKFTPAGGCVTARVFSAPGLGVVEVEDTGIGIPPDEQSHLFERFFRASTATRGALPGTGLGLSITKAIAEAHGGRIALRSAPGRGSCFRVELPA